MQMLVLLRKSSLAGKASSDDHSVPGHWADGEGGGQEEDRTWSVVMALTTDGERIVDDNLE